VVQEIAEYTPLYGLAFLVHAPLLETTPHLAWIANAVVWLGIFIAGAVWRFRKDTARGRDRARPDRESRWQRRQPGWRTRAGAGNNTGAERHRRGPGHRDRDGLVGAGRHVGLTLASLAATTAYGSGPILLLTAIPMLIIANAYRRLNMWNAHAGASFEWVGRAINPYLGFLTGWLMVWPTSSARSARSRSSARR
jgi:hypothetical protein